MTFLTESTSKWHGPIRPILAALSPGNGRSTKLNGLLSKKLKIDKKDLFKPKDSERVITNAHGQKVGVTILKNKKDGKFYAVDDEGIVYKSKTRKFDSEEDYEPEFDLGGFPGAQTQKGLDRIDNRQPDEYGGAEEVSFDDLLDLLGLDEF